MKTLELRDKPLFQATLGDLIEALNEGFANEGKDGRANTNPSSEKRYVYGLFGISKLFGCSQATAQRIKSSGVIDAANFSKWEDHCSRCRSSSRFTKSV